MSAPPSINTNPAATPLILTPADINRLLVDDSHDSRLSVLEKVSAHYNSESFHGREREIAEQIFRMLAKDVTLRVRETLAERLKANANTPRDVVLLLASDVESVALPVLEASLVLSDADLVSIIDASHDMSKLMAISRRETVSSRVSEALVETQYPQVVTSLLANAGATISDRSYEKIAADFKDETSIVDAVARRDPLPRNVVEQLVAKVSAAVADSLKTRYGITESDLKKNTGGRDDVIALLLEGTLDRAGIEKLVDRLIAENKLTPSVVMTALCRGQLAFFTIAIARFADIPVHNAETLLSDKGQLGFTGLYQKSGLPESMHDAIRVLLRAVRELEGGDSIPGSLHYANILVTRVVSLAGDQPIEYLPYFIALIRQNLR